MLLAFLSASSPKVSAMAAGAMPPRVPVSINSIVDPFRCTCLHYFYRKTLAEPRERFPYIRSWPLSYSKFFDSE
ncbi:hypothetical protein EDB84DRAFT_1513902 [Lactarius hengduanensis]|nr:hypothetical protein EDB84DRAFT_1513902 [Lactarius hengduanensis]